MSETGCDWYRVRKMVISGAFVDTKIFVENDK